MKYWLMKTEPNVYSIDDLQKDGTTHWEGVRNYQARNYMRDDMKIGDLVLFYHSNAKPPGVAGIGRVCKESYPDFFSWDPNSHYFDPKASPDNPRWFMVDVEFVEKFAEIVSLDELKEHPALNGMLVIKRGMRLSVQPVEKEHFDIVVKMGKDKS
jgi:predicted RNA-binding protein with PUA-like domain